METYVTKLSTLKLFMAVGDHRAALKLAASWGRGLGDEQEVITRGWEAMARPQFYRDIGKDPDALVAAGLAAIRSKYDIP